MSQTILLKRSAVPGKAPQVADLQPGEIAVNTYDGKMYIKKDDGTPTIEEIGGDQFPSQIGNAGKFLKTDGTQPVWSETGGTSMRVDNGTAHGFSVGKVLRFNGTSYALANASTETTADVVGIVTAVISTTVFEITTSGIVTLPQSFTPGTAYFLSTTAGALTATEPTAVSTISKPLFIALGVNTGLFYNWRGIENSDPVEIDDMLPDQTGLANTVLTTDGTSAGWTSIAQATASTTVNAANSFSVGDVVRTSGSSFVLARANNATNAQVYGIISFASPTQYTITTQGIVPLMSALTPGALYYLSDTTAGELTTTEPTTSTSISKPIFIATSATQGVFFNQRGLPVAIANATPTQILPAQSGNNGKFLTTDGATPSWTSIVSGVSSVRVGTSGPTYTGAVILSGTDLSAAIGTTAVTNATNATNATNSTNATYANYLNDIQQINTVTGAQKSMSMTQDGGATRGSFVAKATGTGDANLAGMSFWNDAYAVKMGIRADGYFGLGGWSRAAWSWYSDPSGNMVAAGNVGAYSDPRLKENFTKIENALEILDQLNGGSFNWKTGIAHTEVKAGKKDYGILSNEVEAVFPEIVSDSISLDGEVYKTVAYDKLIPLLIEAVKELHAIVKSGK